MTAMRGVTIVDGEAEGAALVTTENLAFALVDPASGIVRQPGHPWFGTSIAGRVLVFPSGKGSSSGSYWLLNLGHAGNAPAAIVNTQTDAVIVAGAVLANVPLVHRASPDPLTHIRDGDPVRVRAGGVIESGAAHAADSRTHHYSAPPRELALTPHQRSMLEGRHGWPQQLGMRLLAAVARAFDAEALIPVASVHLSLSGASVGEPGLKLFEEIAARDGRFVVPTTLNVLSLDRNASGRNPQLQAKERVQREILAACERMGALATCSCNPFLLGFLPARGESVAWNESATAPYVNAILGARTNREGATALASALTGYTAAYGMHVDANRRAAVIIALDIPVTGSDAWAVLGGAVARLCGNRTPVLTGIAAHPSLDELTAFCASFATVGPLSSFHIAGITPEAATLDEALGRDALQAADGAANAAVVDASQAASQAQSQAESLAEGQAESQAESQAEGRTRSQAARSVGRDAARDVETLRLGAAELAFEATRYSTATGDRLDTVAVGCPHASLAQVREVADLVAAQCVAPGTTFLLQTSAAIARQAEVEGLRARLEAAGVELTADTCVHIAYREPPPGSTLATNALKIAYLTASHDVAVRFGPLAQCVRSAIAGRWVVD